jgi:ribose/xylose/arabinose/galactoside ABC-type transport system permease subunit
MDFIKDNLIFILVAYLIFSEYRRRKRNQSKAPETFEKSFFQEKVAQKKKTFTDLWPDIWVIPLVIAIAFGLLFGLTILFPNAHFYGVEAIQGVIIGLASAFIVFTIAFIAIKLNFPRTWEWYKSNEIEESFTRLSAWEKYKTLLSTLFIFCLVVVIAMLAQK